MSKGEGRLRLTQKGLKVESENWPLTCNCDAPGTHIACDSHGLFGKSFLLLRVGATPLGKDGSCPVEGEIRVQ